MDQAQGRLSKEEFMVAFRAFVKFVEDGAAARRFHVLEEGLEDDGIMFIMTSLYKEKEFIEKHGMFHLSYVTPNCSFEAKEFHSEAIVNHMENQNLKNQVDKLGANLINKIFRDSNYEVEMKFARDEVEGISRTPGVRNKAKAKKKAVRKKK